MRQLWNLLTVLAVVIAVAAWMALPVAGVLPLLLMLLMWLSATRSGRLACAAMQVGLSSLPQRWGAASVVVIGIGGVVAVLVSMLAMAAGFRATLNASGSEDTAIVLRGGAYTEVNSVITRDQAILLDNLDGVARNAQGRGLISPEMAQVIYLNSRSDGSEANVQLRGVGPLAFEIRDNVRIIEGRTFQAGLREIIVGKGVASQYQGVNVGDTLRLRNQDWSVVGMFASGDTQESELWTDIETLSSFYRRNAYQSVVVKLDGGDGLTRFQTALDADLRLKLDSETTRSYFSRQAGNMSKVIDILGTVVGAIMAVGAIFGALNSMYAAVAARAREMGTLRAIGFGGLPVVVAVLLETLLLALAGGLLGGALSYLVFNGYSASTMGSNFSTIVFAFDVNLILLWTGLKWALGIGLVGGLFPALRAARVPITTALRAV